MKKTLKIFAFAVIALAALASCAKDQFKENAIPAGEKIQVSINGLIGELTPADATKATAGSVVRVTWENGDKVYVYDGSSASLDSLTVTPDDNNASYALLSGTITASSASPAPTKLTLVYVKGAESAPAIAGGKISVDLSTQNEAEVPFVLFSSIDYATDALSKAKECINFEFATSVMTVNCTDLPTGAENAKIDITKAEIDGVSTACELAVTGSGVTVAGASKGTITRTAGFEQSDSRGAFRLALAADPAAPAARNILVHQGSKVSGAPFTTATLAAGKSYNTVYQMGEYIPTPPAGYSPAVKVTGVTLNKSKTEIEAGAKDTLVATVAPADATNKQVAWSSSDEAVATVDENGEVTGVAEGSAVITATTADGNFTAVCLVTVTQGLPAGVLPGVFTVGNGADGKEGTADDVKVHFSQGNLTYNVSTSTWAFYGHQYDCAEEYDANIISLLTWGYDATTSIKPDGTDGVGGHNVGESFNKSEDWGYVFGGESSIWRTLSTAEWQYLLNLGDYRSDIRKGKYKNNVYVGSVPGCAIAPDDFTGTLKDTYTDDKELAKDKLVFLPYAGYRYGTEVKHVYNVGHYWTSFSDKNSYYVLAYEVYIRSTEAKLDSEDGGRGYSVRLITEVK